MPLFGEPDDLANRRHLAALDRRRLVGLAALDRCRLAAPLIFVALIVFVAGVPRICGAVGRLCIGSTMSLKLLLQVSGM